MIEVPSDERLQSLARAVAAGRSPTSWARKHYVPAEQANAWCLLPEFRGLVDNHRLRVADRITGKLMTRARRAMDDTYTALRCGSAYPVKLRAGRILIDSWLVVSRRFDDWRRLRELELRLIELQQQDSAPQFGQHQPSGSGQNQSPRPLTYHQQSVSGSPVDGNI